MSIERVTDRSVALVADVAVDRGRARVPVVQMEDVDRPAVGTERLERGAAEQPEAPRVVRVVAVRVAVEPLAVEGRRMVDEAQPVAVGRRRRGRSPRCSPIVPADPARAGRIDRSTVGGSGTPR